METDNTVFNVHTAAGIHSAASPLHLCFAQLFLSAVEVSPAPPLVSTLSHLPISLISVIQTLLTVRIPVCSPPSICLLSFGFYAPWPHSAVLDTPLFLHEALQLHPDYLHVGSLLTDLQHFHSSFCSITEQVTPRHTRAMPIKETQEFIRTSSFNHAPD